MSLVNREWLAVELGPQYALQWISKEMRQGRSLTEHVSSRIKSVPGSITGYLPPGVQETVAQNFDYIPNWNEGEGCSAEETIAFAAEILHEEMKASGGTTLVEDSLAQWWDPATQRELRAGAPLVRFDEEVYAIAEPSGDLDSVTAAYREASRFYTLAAVAPVHTLPEPPGELSPHQIVDFASNARLVTVSAYHSEGLLVWKADS